MGIKCGGITGWSANSEIKQSYNYGTIYGENHTVGGIVGCASLNTTVTNALNNRYC